jgi:Cu2+-exporting ATPase
MEPGHSPAPAASSGPAQAPETAARLLGWVAALERRSEHPLGHALAEFAMRSGTAPDGERWPAVAGLRHVPGGGVEATVDGVLLRLGTPAFSAAIAAPAAAQGDHRADSAFRPPIDPAADDAMQRGETVVVLGDTAGPLARFTLADQLRPGARELLDGLRARGAKVFLLSGDQPATVGAIARVLGFTAGIDTDAASVRGGMTPQSKLSFVRELQAAGAVVAMFGDGVNDAPVLAQAQVSIAPGSATQVAQAAADMIWLASGESADMRRLLEAIGTARRALRVIRENLAWATAYNLIAVPLAIAGLVTPWVAALGMSASSLLVVGNAMRLVAGQGPVRQPMAPAQQPATAPTA